MSGHSELVRPGTPLSPSELEILPLMAEGLSDKEIGAEIWRAVDTVKTHNRRMFKRMGARNRAHAIALAYETGLLGGVVEQIDVPQVTAMPSRDLPHPIAVNVCVFGGIRVEFNQETCAGRVDIGDLHVVDMPTVEMNIARFTRDCPAVEVIGTDGKAVRYMIGILNEFWRQVPSWAA